MTAIFIIFMLSLLAIFNTIILVALWVTWKGRQARLVVENLDQLVLITTLLALGLLINYGAFKALIALLSMEVVP